MAVLTAERLLYILGSLLIITIGSVLSLIRIETYAKAPKISIEESEVIVRREERFIYVDLKIVFATNTKLCIHYILLRDTGNRDVVFGNGNEDGYEVSNLPICVDPGSMMVFSAYHSLPGEGGFKPGTVVIILLYYSFSPERIVFNKNSTDVLILDTYVRSG